MFRGWPLRGRDATNAEEEEEKSRGKVRMELELSTYLIRNSVVGSEGLRSPAEIIQWIPRRFTDSNA